jgi:putative ABC transport system permease protein
MRKVSLRLGGFLLDFKLALRMLVKYPLLTIVGGIGMAFGIAAGVGGFEIRTQFVDPTLPLDQGRRIVGLRNWDARNDHPAPTSDADFRAWREQLQRMQDLGAVALVERNLTVDGHTEPIGVAEMTASGFRIARVPPRLGRALVDDDERPGAAPVAVIGHALWQRRFASDPRIVGRTVRLGIEQTTIVGVMPEAFEFPVAHQIWTPLRHDASGVRHVFGRLASGIARDEAQAELTTVGQRMATDAPDTHAFLRPEVVPYGHLVFDPRTFSLALTLSNVFLVMMVVVVAANVALLMFARAASREVEIGVRSALGASRGRIVVQLFVEAVVLAGISVVAGLFASRYALRSLLQTLEAESGTTFPFWMNDSLTPSSIAYGGALTMLVAVIIGVLPALKVTGGTLSTRLRSLSAGGGYRFGGVWTAVIATQVAVTVLFPAAAFFFDRGVIGARTRDVGLPAGEYLSARLVMDAGGRGAPATIEELRRQLTAEPGVTAIAVADRLPGMRHSGGRFEVEGDIAPPTYGYDVRTAAVDAEFFGAAGVPLMSGRAFALTDFASDRQVAVVNASFVQRVLRGSNPLGRRIRRVTREGEGQQPWIDIVGVVRDLGMGGIDGAGLYRPLAPDYSTVHVALHVAGTPTALADRLRAVASRVEPTLRVYDVMPLDRVGADQWIESQYLSRLLMLLSGITLLVSLMAIYAVLSFTVVQRRREIGTRVALGADRWRVIAAIVRRPLVQIGLGIGCGSVLVVLFFGALYQSAPAPREAGLIAAYAMLMLAVCLSACIIPIRRALSLQPSQVLRAEG